MKKTTLKDISKFTGLSISTVSRILRGESKADSSNVKATIEAAIKLNYPINVNHLNAKYNFKTTYHIALVTTFYPGEFYSMFFDGMKEAAKLENFTVSLHDFSPENGDIVEFFNSLISLQIDAAILFLPTLPEHDYQRLLDYIPSTFAIISVLPTLHPVLDTITFDSYGGGYLVAQHFYNRGYRQVGIINGPFNRNESLLRRNGFNDFISQNPDMHLVWSYDGNFNFEDGEKAFDNFHEQAIKPRAVFATNDEMCLGFLKRAFENGYSIPSDVAIAGYDDLPVCKYVHPTITSIHTDYKALGKKAFKILHDKINSNDNHTGMQSIIPVSLSIRESS